MMRTYAHALLLLLVAPCLLVFGDSASQAPFALPPQADSPIKLKVSDVTVEALGVEEQCRGTFIIKNRGADFVLPSTTTGPSYGVFIYDAAGTMLFRNFSGWSSGFPKSGKSISFRWNTKSNHLGKISEPPFVVPKPGVYELVVVVYPGKRDTMLCYSRKKFEVGCDR